MKTIKINYLTYYFLIIYFLCGLFKTGIIVFIIVIFHELGHTVAALINKYKIIDITIYPFGGITRLEKDINSPIIKDLFLASAGIIFQIILFLIFMFLNKEHIITNKTFNVFLTYNNLIMFFNLLPIVPLDGSHISEIIFNIFLSFKTSQKINLVFSVITLIVFIIINYQYSLNNYMIVFFLIFKIIENKKNLKTIFNKFLLERYLKNYSFRKIKHEKEVNVNKLKKNTYFYFWKNNAWVNEKKAIFNSLKKEKN